MHYTRQRLDTPQVLCRLAAELDESARLLRTAAQDDAGQVRRQRVTAAADRVDRTLPHLDRLTTE